MLRADLDAFAAGAACIGVLDEGLFAAVCPSFDAALEAECLAITCLEHADDEYIVGADADAGAFAFAAVAVNHGDECACGMFGGLSLHGYPLWLNRFSDELLRARVIQM